MVSEALVSNTYEPYLLDSIVAAFAGREDMALSDLSRFVDSDSSIQLAKHVCKLRQLGVLRKSGNNYSVMDKGALAEFHIECGHQSPTDTSSVRVVQGLRATAAIDGRVAHAENRANGTCTSNRGQEASGVGKIRYGTIPYYLCLAFKDANFEAECTNAMLYEILIGHGVACKESTIMVYTSLLSKKSIFSDKPVLVKSREPKVRLISYRWANNYTF